MGALEYLSQLCRVTSTRRRRKKPLQTVELRVEMDCDGCERRVRNAVCSLKGVMSADVNRKLGKVTVRGNVDRNKVVRWVGARTGKVVELWPYVPYHLVYYPYAASSYDWEAPPGYVRAIDHHLQQQHPLDPNGVELTYTYLFSDENTTAFCSIM